MSNIYTVVGLHPDSDWSQGMREATFVTFVPAMSPCHAAILAKREIIAETADDSFGSVYVEDDFEIIAVFEGAQPDQYLPDVAADNRYMKELDNELSAAAAGAS